MSFLMKKRFFLSELSQNQSRCEKDFTVIHQHDSVHHYDHTSNINKVNEQANNRKTMMIVNPDAYSKFIGINGSTFPYRHCRKTRRSFHVKWLLVDTPNDNESRDIFTWTALKSTTFTKKTVNHLIMTKQAYPVPPDMSEIMDVMHVWGKRYDEVWCKRVYDYCAHLCTERYDIGRKLLFHHCLEFMVDLMLTKHFGHIPFCEIHAFMECWEECFQDEYTYGRRGFRHLSYVCFNDALGMIHMQLHTQPAPDAVVAPAVISSSS